MGFTENERDLHRFKPPPSLRNIAQTAPCLHDGTAATPGDAVKAMMRFRTGAAYTQQEVDQIVDFLGSLTGENPHME